MMPKAARSPTVSRLRVSCLHLLQALGRDADSSRRMENRDLTRERRRTQLLACADALANLAEHRSIEPMRPGLVEHDLEIRQALDRVVRRWSKLVSIAYVSGSMTSAVRRTGTVSEHVVPCRVLVDRMIMRPQDAPALLESALVLARISKSEHSLLGSFHKDPKLYARMLISPIEKLPSLGR
jgi:hypothetical protein